MKVDKKGKKSNGKDKYIIKSHISETSKAKIKKKAVTAVNE